MYYNENLVENEELDQVYQAIAHLIEDQKKLLERIEKLERGLTK